MEGYLKGKEEGGGGFSHEEYAQVMGYLIEEMKKEPDMIPHVIVDCMEVAKDPMICFNVGTDFREVHEKIEIEIRNLEM